MRLPSLPIDDALPAVREALERGTRLVLQAPPGAGKTTRVPLALLDAPWCGPGRIVMLEPRRLAARAAAQHMARALGERVGETIGYRIRGDRAVSRRTRVEVVTEGILTRMLQDDPALEGISAVLFDEFHERNLVADLGLALTLHSAALVRPELRIVVMSATLDGARTAQLLGDAPIVTSTGRAFPVETRYAPPRPDVRMEGHLAAVVARALREHEGDVLVFVPGAAETRRTAAALAERGLPAGTSLFALHGAMPAEEQDAAIAPGAPGARKVVLATAVAETSLTIEGVRIVVDSGWSRVARFSPRSGMTRLETVRVARASADQRRGRAGRLAPGVCYRCWDEGDDAQLLAFRAPEIMEADLAPLALELAAAGIRDPAALAWLDAPPASALEQARQLLRSLGALTADRAVTPHGREMAALGVHPRMAHLLIRARATGAGASACLIAAMLGERDVLRRDAAIEDPDLATRLDLLRRPRGDADPRVDRGRWHRVREEARRLRAEVGVGPADHDEIPAAELTALAYPERVAFARSGSRGRFLMRNGRAVQVDERSPLADAEALAIAETDGRVAEARVYLAAATTVRAVAEQFADEIEETETVEYVAASDRVRAVRERRLGALVLETRPLTKPSPEGIARAWMAVVRAEGPEALPWSDAARSLRDRVRFARTLDERWPDWSDAALWSRAESWLLPALHGVQHRTDLARLDLVAALRTELDWRLVSELDRLAPTHLEVPSGSRIAVDYSTPESPVLRVRLQEMFGAAETPRVGGGRVPVALHLLSPAHRPVQVTRDLAGFWANIYFAVRKELRGRYPRHSWPDDPLHAEATRRAKPRGG